MKTNISVIICTHNPRQDYFEKVLKALKAQTLSFQVWELLIIDNASEKILSSEIDISWHPQARHIREEQLGLTPARLRGIKEATAETLVFVDDDNVLDADFLEVALKISKDYPLIGAWGGQIRPEFEETPPEWTKPYWVMLAVREFNQDKWSNLLFEPATAPCGAGMCVRKNVANKYAHLVSNEFKRLDMGRKGELLTSGEDWDLAFTACEMGLGNGQFTSLKLTHLIPPHRLNEDYLQRLAEGLSYSGTILKYLWNQLPPEPCISDKILQHYQRLRLDSRRRKFYDATQKGFRRAMKQILAWQKSTSINV